MTELMAAFSSLRRSVDGHRPEFNRATADEYMHSVKLKFEVAYRIANTVAYSVHERKEVPEAGAEPCPVVES